MAHLGGFMLRIMVVQKTIHNDLEEHEQESQTEKGEEHCTQREEHMQRPRREEGLWG